MSVLEQETCYGSPISPTFLSVQWLWESSTVFVQWKCSYVRYKWKVRALCEWTHLPSHSEGFLVSDTRKGRWCQAVTGAGCEAATVFWAHLKDGFDFTSRGRCSEVSCSPRPMTNVPSLQSPASLAWILLSLRNSGSEGAGVRERYQRGQETTEKKRRGWIRPCESALHFHLPEKAPKTTTCECHAINQAVI